MIMVLLHYIILDIDLGPQIMINYPNKGSSGSKIYQKSCDNNLGHFMNQKKMNVKESQRMMQSSDTDEIRKLTSQINHNSSKRSSQGKLLYNLEIIKF